MWLVSNLHKFLFFVGNGFLCWYQIKLDLETTSNINSCQNDNNQPKKCQKQIKILDYNKSSFFNRKRYQNKKSISFHLNYLLKFSNNLIILLDVKVRKKNQTIKKFEL